MFVAERYWITGVQIGMIKATLEHGSPSAFKLIDEIVDKQFIGRMPEPYEDYEIIIVRKKK